MHSIFWRTRRCLEFLDGSPEDALLEVHLYAEVFAYLCGCVVALGRGDGEAETIDEGEDLILASHGLVEVVREDVEVVHEGRGEAEFPCACGVGEVISSLPLQRGLEADPGEQLPRDPVACSRTRTSVNF